MRGERFPRTGRLHKGYHRKQVDHFLNHVELALSGAMPPPTAAEVREAGFELVRGGYVTSDVDHALDALEERVLDAQTAGRRGRSDPASEVAFLRGELSAPYMQRFPRARGFRRGYDIDDVDTFIDQVIAALDVTDPAAHGPGSSRVSVDVVRSAPFRSRRGGYREDAVDQMLDRVVELLLVLRQEHSDHSSGPTTPQP